MKSRIYGKRIFPMLAIFALSLFAATGCKDDKDNPGAENNPGNLAPLSLDDLNWFADNLVATDVDGNLKHYMYGRVLDPATPHTLYIGVETAAEAAEIFKGWIAPETASQLDISQDGSMTYHPKDAWGKNQGEIFFKKSSGEEENIAHITFSKDATIPYISEIKFIPNDLWPDNDDIISPYSVGDIVDFNTDEDGYHRFGMQKAVCLREPSKYQPGLIVYFSHTKITFYTKDDIFYLNDAAGINTAIQIANIINSDWDYFASIYESTGVTLSETDTYWTGVGIWERPELYPWDIFHYAIHLKSTNYQIYHVHPENLMKSIILYKPFTGTSI